MDVVARNAVPFSTHVDISWPTEKVLSHQFSWWLVLDGTAAGGS